MKVQYIANDGRVFDTQEDCEDYEATLNIQHCLARFHNSPVYFLNGNNQNILEKLIKKPSAYLDELTTIYIKENAKRWLEELKLVNKSDMYSDYFPPYEVFEKAITGIEETKIDEAYITWDEERIDWYNIQYMKNRIDEFMSNIKKAVY